MSHFGHQPPYIIDPANPANNVYLSGVTCKDGSGNSSWKKLKDHIDRLDLTVPLHTGYQIISMHYGQDKYQFLIAEHFDQKRTS